MTCTIEGCERNHHARGWCNLHYHQWRTYGDPLAHGSRQGQLLPFEPLWNLVRPEHQGELAERVGVTRRTVTRWKAHGVPLLHADTIAARLGLHPQSIWPGCAA